MKIAFLSNYLNHHQRELCNALFTQVEGNFRFIVTSRMRAERKALGYGEHDTPEYVLDICESEAARDEALTWLREADAVIVGTCPESLLEERFASGGLLFRYSERPLKKGLEPMKYFPRLLKWRKRNPKRKPIYLLCASAYAAKDYASFGLFRGKAFKWGYFPPLCRYDEDMPKKDPQQILWVGRFIYWKHPDDALRAAAMLKEDGFRFRMKLIGTGASEAELRDMIRTFSLEQEVTVLPPVKAHEVRSHMEQAGIYLATSDRQEGWGAVVNEAMNSGCAVIASRAMGSAPYLIQDGKNGMLYPSGDVFALYERLRELLTDPQRQRELGKAAYETILKEWNGAVAAERLVELIRSIQEGTPVRFQTGPCSPSELLQDH